MRTDKNVLVYAKSVQDAKERAKEILLDYSIEHGEMFEGIEIEKVRKLKPSDTAKDWDYFSISNTAHADEKGFRGFIVTVEV